MLKKGLLIVLALFLATSVEARSGCCSHHGGVCGCGCCDGSGLSATCAPYYPQCGGGSTYSAPVFVPSIPENPIKTGSTRYIQSATKPYFTVTQSWDGSYPVSIAISKVMGANPGPNTDTANGFFQFNNVTSGRWYINMKAGVNDVWSKVSYWTVDVPAWIDPTPTPTPLPTSTPMPNIIPIDSIAPTGSVQGAQTSSPMDTAAGVATGGIGAFVGLKILMWIVKKLA